MEVDECSNSMTLLCPSGCSRSPIRLNASGPFNLGEELTRNRKRWIDMQKRLREVLKGNRLSKRGQEHALPDDCAC